MLFCANGYAIHLTTPVTVSNGLDDTLEYFFKFYLSLAGLEMVLDSNEDYVTSEMEKQKRKLKDMTKLIEQQHQLLRLIVQV